MAAYGKLKLLIWSFEKNIAKLGLNEWKNDCILSSVIQKELNLRIKEVLLANKENKLFRLLSGHTIDSS